MYLNALKQCFPNFFSLYCLIS